MEFIISEISYGVSRNLLITYDFCSPSCLEYGWKYVLDVKASATKLEYWNVLKLHFFFKYKNKKYYH